MSASHFSAVERASPPAVTRPPVQDLADSLGLHHVFVAEVAAVPWRQYANVTQQHVEVVAASVAAALAQQAEGRSGEEGHAWETGDFCASAKPQHPGPAAEQELADLKACVQTAGWTPRATSDLVNVYSGMRAGFQRNDVFWLTALAKRAAEGQLLWTAARVAKQLRLREECHRLCVSGLRQRDMPPEWTGKLAVELVTDLIAEGDYGVAREHLHALLQPAFQRRLSLADGEKLFHLRLLTELADAKTPAAVAEARRVAESLPELARTPLAQRTRGLIHMVANDWAAAQPLLRRALASAVAAWPMLPEYHGAGALCAAWGLVDWSDPRVAQGKQPPGWQGLGVWREAEEVGRVGTLFGHQAFAAVTSPRSDLYSMRHTEGEVVHLWLRDAWVESTAEAPGVSYLHAGCHFHAVAKLFVAGLKTIPAAASLQQRAVQAVDKAAYLHWSGGNYYTFSCEVVAKILLLRRRGLLSGGSSPEGGFLRAASLCGGRKTRMW